MADECENMNDKQITIIENYISLGRPIAILITNIFILNSIVKVSKSDKWGWQFLYTQNFKVEKEAGGTQGKPMASQDNQ